MSEIKAAYAAHQKVVTDGLEADLREEHTHNWYVEYTELDGPEGRVGYIYAGCHTCDAVRLEQEEIEAILNRVVQPRFSGFGRLETWDGKRLEI